MFDFKKDFAIFILSHGRAETISTPRAIIEAGYTGDWYVMIDDEDDQEGLYREKFGDHIVQFEKKKEAEMTDTGDSDDDRRVGVFARNAIQKASKEMGYKCHAQFDDDFHLFDRRYIKDGRLIAEKVNDLDLILEAMAEFLMSTPITNLSFGLSAYYLGGIMGK